MGVEYLAGRFRDSGEDVAMTIAEMTGAIKRADAIIHSLLEFAAAGRQEGTEANLKQAIEGALVLVYHQLRQKRIRVVRRLAEEPPPVRKGRHRIEQVFLELFSHVIAAMPLDSELQLASRVQTDDDGRRKIVATAESNGPRVPPESLLKISGPFFSPKPTDMGQNLGLALARS